MNRKGPAAEIRLVGAERVRAVVRGFLVDNLVYKILSLVLALAVWGVVQEPVEHADGGGVFGHEPSPLNWNWHWFVVASSPCG